MKPKTKTILFILLSFILGIVCGWLVQEHISVKTGHTPPEFLKMLTERLHLDERQIVQVDSILDARKKQMDVHRKEMLAMRDTIQMEIRRVLNADQNKIFDEFVQEMNAHDAKKREHDPKK